MGPQKQEKKPYNKRWSHILFRCLVDLYVILHRKFCRGAKGFPLLQVADMMFTILFAVDVLIRICSFCRKGVFCH